MAFCQYFRVQNGAYIRKAFPKPNFCTKANFCIAVLCSGDTWLNCFPFMIGHSLYHEITVQTLLMKLKGFDETNILQIHQTDTFVP